MIEKLDIESKDEVEVRPGVKKDLGEREEILQEAKKFLASVPPVDKDLKISKALCNSAIQYISSCCGWKVAQGCNSEPKDLSYQISDFIDSSKTRKRVFHCGGFDKASDFLVDMIMVLEQQDNLTRDALFNQDFDSYGMGIDPEGKKEWHAIEFAEELKPKETNDELKISNDTEFEEIKDNRAGLVEKIKRPIRRTLRKVDAATTSSKPHAPKPKRRRTSIGHKVRKAKRKLKRTVR